MRDWHGRDRLPPWNTDATMTSRLIDRLTLAATVIIFCIAIVVLLREYATVNPYDVLVRLVAMPTHQVLAAVGLTALNYLCLTGYDFLALRYAGCRLRFRDVLFASFTAFAFSNNLGFQLLSGGSIRYRIYSSYGLNAVEIGKIIAFCTIAYALGVITVGGLLALVEPRAIAALLHLPQLSVRAGGVLMIACSVGYLALAAVWGRPIGFGRLRLQPPSPVLALAQVTLASIDAVLAGTVMYALLPADFGVTYEYFLGVYLIAATASVLSLVPGGLGVFETAVTIMTIPAAKAAVLGAFLAYRMIYFIFPLVIAITGFTLHEFRGRLAANA